MQDSKTNENMENKEIIEGNKLVAEFDGWVIDNSFPDKDRTYIKNGGIELDTTFTLVPVS